GLHFAVEASGDLKLNTQTLVLVRQQFQRLLGHALLVARVPLDEQILAAHQSATDDDDAKSHEQLCSDLPLHRRTILPRKSKLDNRNSKITASAETMSSLAINEPSV